MPFWIEAEEPAKAKHPFIKEENSLANRVWFSWGSQSHSKTISYVIAHSNSYAISVEAEKLIKAKQPFIKEESSLANRI